MCVVVAGCINHNSDSVFGGHKCGAFATVSHGTSYLIDCRCSRTENYHREKDIYSLCEYLTGVVSGNWWLDDRFAGGYCDIFTCFGNHVLAYCGSCTILLIILEVPYLLLNL